MKKFLLSVAMFMAGMGAWAQETTTVTEEEMNALLAKTQDAHMTYMYAQWGLPVPIGYPKLDAEVTTDLLKCIEDATNDKTSKVFYDALDVATEAFLNEDKQIVMPEDGKAYYLTALWNPEKMPIFWEGETKGYVPSNQDPYGTEFVCKKVGEQYLFVSDNGYYFGWKAQDQEDYTKQTYDENQLFTLEKANLTENGGTITGVSMTDLLGKFCMQANNGHYLMYDRKTSTYYSATEGSKCFSADGVTVFFTLTEVADYTTNLFTVKDEADLNDTHVATFIAPYATTLPEGYKAYTANSVDGTTVNLVKLTGDIPANTAVVITGEPCENKTVSLSTTNPKAITGNKLFGYTTDTTVGSKTDLVGTAYALGKVNDVVAFYQYTGENFLAGKAYLDAGDVAASARILVFNFGGDTETAIESIEGAEGAADAVVYDLAGRRVHGAQKGLYIVNGKKVIK